MTLAFSPGGSRAAEIWLACLGVAFAAGLAFISLDLLTDGRLTAWVTRTAGPVLAPVPDTPDAPGEHGAA